MDAKKMERVEVKPPQLSQEDREREAAFLKNASGEDLQKLFRQAQVSKSKDLNLSEEEAKRIDSAFEKPEFMDLFREYVDDISDPKNMEEYDQYLRQLEEEGEIPEDEEVVRPEKGFVVKTKATDTGSKLFINCAGTDKVPAPTQNSTAGDVSPSDTTGSKGQGSYWSIPYIHTALRMDRDKSDQPCHVYDILFNTETLRLAEKHAPFKALVVQTALESLEENGKMKLKDPSTGKYDYSILKNMRYKGNVVRPHKLKKEPAVPSAKSKPSPSSSKPPSSPPAPPPEPSGPVAPKVSLIHRGELAWSDAMGSVGSILQPLSRRPKEVVVRLELPLLETSIADMQLDIKGGFLEFECGGVYKLKYKLPYPVDDTSGDAKYSKAQKLLTVTLSVLPWTEGEILAEQHRVQARQEEEEQRRKEEEEREQEEAAARRKEEEEEAKRVVKKGFLSAPKKSEGGGKTASEPAKPAPDSKAAAESAERPAAEEAEAEAEIVGGGAKPLIEDLGSYEEGGKKGEGAGSAGKKEEAGGKGGEEGEVEEGGEVEKPPMSFRQNQQNVTVVVRVEGIRPGSVTVDFQKRALRVTCAAKGQRYSEEVYLGGAVEVGACRYDVTESNMVVVLRKKKAGRWASVTVEELAQEEEEEEEKEEAAAAARSEGSAEEKAKEGGAAGGEEAGKEGGKKHVRWQEEPAEKRAGDEGGRKEEGKVEGKREGEGEGEGKGEVEGGGEGEFVAAAAFEGAREGFVFKKGGRGLGYYKDGVAVTGKSESSNGGAKFAKTAEAVEEELEKKREESGDEVVRGLMGSGEKMAMPKMAFTNSLAFDLD